MNRLLRYIHLTHRGLAHGILAHKHHLRFRVKLGISHERSVENIKLVPKADSAHL